MLKMGVPVHAVAQKMQLEGFDPGVLSGEGEGEHRGKPSSAASAWNPSW